MCTPDLFKNQLMRDWNETTKAIKGYHIHIYADNSQAYALLGALEALFSDDIRDVHTIGAIGPHTASNITVEITAESFGRIVQWMQMHNNGLSILVHPETGDDLKDHLESSLWIGMPIPYNEKFFERLKGRRPAGPAPQ